MTTPEKHYVHSSNVEAIGYNADEMALHVWFLNGSHYLYRGVPEGLFHDLLNAPSVGSMLNLDIKGTYEYERIE